MILMASGPPLKKKRKKPKGVPFPRGMVLWVWLLGLLALAGLIYWGNSSKPERPRVQTSTQAQKKPADKAFDHREPARSKETDRPQPRAPLDQRQHRGPARKSVDDSPEPAKAHQPPADKPHVTDAGPLLTAHVPHSTAREPEKPIPLPPQPPLTPPMARVAIVIDDFGQNPEIARRFLEVPMNLTFAVLPHQRHTQEIAALVKEHHRQVILHLPMEPLNYPKVNPGKGALLLSMSDAALQQSLRSALDASPHFAGINNHMGSHFTQNARAMRMVLEEARRRELYFIDSYTSPRSVAAMVAQQVQIPVRRRDIFLDNNQSESAVRAQLVQLRRRARSQGTALAIGHPHETTLRALLNEGDAFEREEIAVVPASELMPGF